MIIILVPVFFFVIFYIRWEELQIGTLRFDDDDARAAQIFVHFFAVTARHCDVKTPNFTFYKRHHWL